MRLFRRRPRQTLTPTYDAAQAAAARLNQPSGTERDPVELIHTTQSKPLGSALPEFNLAQRARDVWRQGPYAITTRLTAEGQARTTQGQSPIAGVNVATAASGLADYINNAMRKITADAHADAENALLGDLSKFKPTGVIPDNPVGVTAAGGHVTPETLRAVRDAAGPTPPKPPGGAATCGKRRAHPEHDGCPGLTQVGEAFLFGQRYGREVPPRHRYKGYNYFVQEANAGRVADRQHRRVTLALRAAEVVEEEFPVAGVRYRSPLAVCGLLAARGWLREPHDDVRIHCDHTAFDMDGETAVCQGCGAEGRVVWDGPA